MSRIIWSDDLSMQLRSDNVWGIPVVKKQDFEITGLVGFNYVLNSGEPDRTVHFFLDDYQFERVWNSPNRYITHLKKFNGCLSPDFSLYRNFPQALSLFNVYRNRAIACFWQAQGINVIPTVSWSDDRSFEYCFLGVEQESPVAISTVGVMNSPDALTFFKRGYYEMMRVLKPSKVIAYGWPVEFLGGQDKFVNFAPFSSKHKAGGETWVEGALKEGGRGAEAGEEARVVVELR